MSSLELWAKKATVRCSEEAANEVLNEVKQMQLEWDSVQAAVADKKARLESRRMQLADCDDTVKRELAWMQDVEQYFASANELCANLAEKKCRLQRTKVCIDNHFRPHHPYYVRRCGLLVPTEWRVLSACLSVCRSVTLVSPAKTAETIQMPFGLRTRVGPRNHLLDGVPIPQ